MRRIVQLLLWTTGVCLVAASASAQSLRFRPGRAAPEVLSDAEAEGGTAELGLYLGGYIPSEEHGLFEPNDEPRDGHRSFSEINPDIGLRVAWVPLDSLALELEAGLIPASLRYVEESALVYVLRGHLLFQYAATDFVPFFVVGAGLAGVSSDRAALGDDRDVAADLGFGGKYYLDGTWGFRFDFRDILAEGRTRDSLSNNVELLLSVFLTFGREPRVLPIPPPDTDGDRFPDDRDRCPNQQGIWPDGCPPPDRDGDRIRDEFDRCPDTPGVLSEYKELNGCPRPTDRDRDGIPDDLDVCPDLLGPAPTGCPTDLDGDGIHDAADDCPEDPETFNGVADEDGCPDELPEEVRQFEGVVEGVYFAVSRAAIRERSHARLDTAVDVLSRFPALRVRISGHTDSTGKAERNQALSQERAQSVKNYLVSHGIDAGRIDAVGEGSSRPLADNGTRQGRAQNRRIEFELLTPEPPPAVQSAPQSPPTDAEPTPDTSSEAGPAGGDAASP